MMAYHSLENAIAFIKQLQSNMIAIDSIFFMNVFVKHLFIVLTKKWI